MNLSRFFYFPTSPAESPVDEVCCCEEVDAQVKATGVMSLYAHVCDLHAPVDTWLSSTLTVSCIQDVCDLMLGLIGRVLCAVPEKHITLSNHRQYLTMKQVLPAETLVCKAFHSEGSIFGIQLQICELVRS